MQAGLVFATLGAEPGAAPSVVIDFQGVRVEGLPAAELAAAAMRPPSREAWREILAVVTSPNGDWGSLPQLLGTYDVSDGALRFRPRFSPAPGLVLEARFDGDAWDRALQQADAATPDATARFTVPTPAPRPATRVTRVFPFQEIPANLLRFYVHFSAPMGERHVLPEVQLLDARGEPVPVAFVEVPGGLWDRQRTRLTLFLHPGRIKRGVGPNQALGPVLEAGKRYRLQIGSQARDAAGQGLAETFEMEFVAGDEDHTSPDPETWTMQAPAFPQAPLHVQLEAPADRALLQRLPEVRDAVGRALPGRMDVGTAGRSFTWTPEVPWRPGPYHLHIPAALEDPSGNRVDRLFEQAPKASEGSSADQGSDLSFLVSGDQPP